MSGLTTTGFERPIQSDIAADIADDVHGTISAQLDTSESTVIGNVINIFADQLAQAWEVLEEAYNAIDPDNATDDRVVALSLLTGTTRLPAQTGIVTVRCNLNATTAFAAGDLAVHAVNDPSNRWINRDAVASTTAGNYDIIFVSDGTGSAFVAPAGTLTVIASPINGFNTATNLADATPGTDEESIENLRLRRELEIARNGSGTLDAIRADVLALPGMLQVLTEENVLDITVGALPPHSLRVVVWDGSPGAVQNNAIAQAIEDSKPAGILSIGSQSGLATRSDGGQVTVNFERATVVDVYVSTNIVSAAGVSRADVQAAIQAAMPILVGGDVVYHKLTAAAFIDGVDDYTTFTIGLAPSPVGTTNLVMASTQIARLQISNITVTGDVA